MQMALYELTALRLTIMCRSAFAIYRQWALIPSVLKTALDTVGRRKGTEREMAVNLNDRHTVVVGLLMPRS